MEASSTINQPHPDDTGTDAPNPDDFFDPTPGEPEPGDPAPAPEGTPEPEATTVTEEPQPDAEPATATPEAATEPAATPAPEEAAAAAAEAQAGAQAQTGEGDGAGASSGDGSGGEDSSSGTPSRNYVILRELTLSPETLKALLAEAESTQGGEYRKAYFELDTIEARNVKHALGAAFNAHNEQIGQKPRLGAIPQRAWQIKTVSPKQRTVESLDIS